MTDLDGLSPEDLEKLAKAAEVDPKLVDLDALAKWMDEQKLAKGEITEVEQLMGGTQNVLVKFSRGGQTFVLRRPPAHPRKYSNDTMRREARVLAAIADSNVPHPKLIASCSEEDVLGVSFYLMEAVNGYNVAHGLNEYHSENESARARMGLAMVEAISELANLDYEKLGLGDFGKVDGYLERQVGRWQSHLETFSKYEGYPGPDITGLDEVAAWLTQNMPRMSKPGILHGDYHIANVMFKHDGPELAAVVDWEQCAIGDPLFDLGWLLATWPDENGVTALGLKIEPWSGFPTGPELVDHYGKVNDRDLERVTWYAVLACYKLGIVLEETHARACAGKAPKLIGDMLHTMSLSFMERALTWIN